MGQRGPRAEGTWLSRTDTGLSYVLRGRRTSSSSSVETGGSPDLGGVRQCVGHLWAPLEAASLPPPVPCFRGSGSTTAQVPLRTTICDVLLEMATAWKLSEGFL